MKTFYTLLGLVVLIAAVVAGFLLLSKESVVDPDPVSVARSAEIVEDGERMIVFDGEGEMVFEYSILEWQQWAQSNLENALTEPVVIGDQEMGPERFDRFNAVAVSPEGDRVAFTVSTYAILTTVSLIGIVEVESQDIAMVRDSAFGGVREMLWSPDGHLIAYPLDTARSTGDHLRVDDIETLAKRWQFSGGDIAEVFERENIELSAEEFLPFFGDLQWREAGERLEFTTLASDQEGRAEWLVNVSTGQLELVFDEDSVNGVVITECFVGGCSGELCSTDPEAVSTCELLAGMECIDTGTMSCGSVEGECRWILTEESARCFSAVEQQHGSEVRASRIGHLFEKAEKLLSR